MAQRSVRTADSRLLPGLVVEDPHRDVVGNADIFKADGPTAALIQVALVEHPDFRIPAEGFRAFHVHETAQHLARARDPERGGVDEVIVAAMHLPDPPVGPEMSRDVKDSLEGLVHDVIAQHLGAVVEIQGVGTRRAEVPSFAGIVQELVAGGEQGTHFRDRIRGLVQLEERRARAAPVGGQSEENQHLVAVLMGVAIAPVRIADIVHTIGAAAAIRSVGDPHPAGVVRGRKREGASPRRDERQNLAGTVSRPDGGAVLLNPSA